MSVYFKCTTNKNPLSYSCGEKIVFSVMPENNCTPVFCKYVHWQLLGDDGKHKEGVSEAGPSSPLVLETTLDRPGFVHLICTAFTEGALPDKSFDVLDAGAGADIEKIEYCDTVPDDFDEYWKALEKLVAEFDYELLLNKPVKNNLPDGFEAYELRISTPDGRPASGFVSMPKSPGQYPINLSFYGYGISGAMPVYAPNTISATFNAHGIENDLSVIELKKKYFKELSRNEGGYSYGFDPEENKSNLTTYWRNMMIRNLISLKYLKTLPCWDNKHVTVIGGSQAALQATTVAAHDKDVTALDIRVPWFCNLNAEAHGYMPGWRPRFAEGLRYFDTVAQATVVNCPVKIIAKLGDYICPPSTIMALYNSFKTNKQLKFIQSGTHGYNPPVVDSFYLENDPQNEICFEPGLYTHYKGGEYELLYTAAYSENYCDTQVVYKSLKDGKIWVRPAHMWNELVEVNGEFVKRFEKK